MRTAKLASHDENIINNNFENIINNDNYDYENTKGALLYKRTLTFGRLFCGKTQLLLSKLQLIQLCDSEKQIKII